MSYDLNSLTPEKRFWITKTSNIPRRFWGVGAEDIAKDIGKYSPDIEEWLESCLEGKIIKSIGGLGETGVGLLFDGKPGMGKTTHAAVTLTEFIRRLPDSQEEACKILGVQSSDYTMRMRPVYYMTFVDFLSRRKAMFDAEPEERRALQREMDGFLGKAKEDYLNVRLLVLDDLGKEYGSKYDDTSFDEVLRTRYDQGLPTIVTTNIPLKNWGTQYSEAMGSFAHEAFSQVRLEGDDLRGKR